MCCIVARFSFGRRMAPRLELFWYTEDLNIIFERGQAICYAVRITVDRCLPEARLV